MSAYEGIEDVAATGAAAIAGLANVIAASTRAVMDPSWKIFAMTEV
jgi:phage I-like protein